MDSIDAGIVNCLQEGLPVCERPFDDVAASLGLSVDELLSRLQRLLDDRVLTRFGPMYNAESMGGALRRRLPGRSMHIPRWRTIMSATIYSTCGS